MPFIRAIPESKPPSKASSVFAAYVEAEKLLQIAFVLPSAVAIGWAVGWWADDRFHQHWMAIVGIIFGSVSGLFYVIQQAITAEKNSRKREPAQNGTGEDSPDNRP